MNGLSQPTSNRERIVVLDALRGFALLGILFVNMTWFTGFAVLSHDQRVALGTETFDTVVDWLIHFLVDGKFWSLFALLFGVGTAIQFKRLATSDIGPNWLARRMFVLVLIGLCHAIFLWFGDIVSLYAVVGFALIPFLRASPRSLLVASFVLLGLPLLQSAIWLVVYNATHTGGPGTDPGHGPAALLPLFGAGIYREVFSANWAFLTERWYLAIYEGRFFKLLGMFLLGYWAGRRGVFEELHLNRTLLFRVLLVGLAIGIPANLYTATITLGGTIPNRPPTNAGWILAAAKTIGIPALCLSYGAGFTLLATHFQSSRIFSGFAHAGRMSLTNYVGQSVIGILIFYGFGLGYWGSIGATWSLALIAAIFVLQIGLSVCWLRSFRHGPLEWLWRCGTYGRWLPILRPTADQANPQQV